jgi:hypothetical protein
MVVGLGLRWWNLGASPPSYDEDFTGVYSHLSVGEMLPALRRQDAHPPLDYLIRHVFGGMGDTFALRVPSAVFATCTLLAVLAWMWDRGWFGVAVVAFTSVSMIELLYGRQARMYALIMLCGTLAAIASERWLEGGESRWVWLAGGALLVGLFDHSTALLLALALFALPAWRRDREAWRWRLTMVGAVCIWGVLWGPSFRDQLRGNPSSWIPLTTVHGTFDAVNGLVSLYPGMAVLTAIALVAGCWLLAIRDHRLARVWLLLFVGPLVLACLIGLRGHFLLPRTLAVSAWAPPVALAAIVDRSRKLWAPVAGVVVLATMLLVFPSVRPALGYDDDSLTAIRAIRDRAQAGDAVAVHPQRFAPLAQWNLGGPQRSDPPDAIRDLDAFVYVLGDQPFDGTVWVLQPDTYALPTGDLVPCGQPPLGIGDYVVACYRTPRMTVAGPR